MSKGGGISKEERIALEHLRFRALDLRKKGWKNKEIAEAYGVHQGSVSRWFTTKERKGSRSLKLKKAKGNPSKLNKEEQRRIIDLMIKPATDYGYQNPLWTCKKIQRLMKDQIGKSLSISNIWEFARRWNLSPQIPIKKAKERNERKIKKWVKKTWYKIDKHRRRWQAMLYLEDESGVYLNPVVGRTWAPRGKTPTVSVSGSRKKLNLLSAITPGGRLVFKIHQKNIKSEEYIEFLTQIIKNHPHRKVIVITDNGSIHKSKLTQGFLKSNEKVLAVYHLPPYAPELNPDEHIWSYLKSHLLNAHQAKEIDELENLTKRKMNSIGRNRNLIRSFFIHSYIT